MIKEMNNHLTFSNKPKKSKTERWWVFFSIFAYLFLCTGFAECKKERNRDWKPHEANWYVHVRCDMFFHAQGNCLIIVYSDYGNTDPLLFSI